jgi:ureidoglycolate dehydrogenase (NAD+)
VLTPAAAHHGFGLALLIESLAGCLSGAATTCRIRSWLGDDPALPTGHGAAFLALDCAAMGDGLPGRVDQLIDEVHAAPTAPGTGRLLVPGELEWDRFAAARVHGIPLPSDVLASLRESAGMARLDLGRYLATAPDGPGERHNLAYDI